MDPHTPYDHGLRIGAAVTIDEHTVRLRLDGELDSPNTGAFTDALADLLTTTAATRIELDAANLTFLDSAGVKALVQTRRAADETGRDLVLIDPHPLVSQVLTITELLADFGLR